VADALVRLTNEYSAIKYDGQSRNFRLADVIQRVHPQPKAEWQRDLFKHLLDRRYDNVTEVPTTLKMIVARYGLESVPAEQRREMLLLNPTLMKEAGYTWEQLSTLGALDAKAWEAVIPNMGYMALLRNLRNFDQAGVSDAVAAQVATKLADPDEVSRSRQFPYRFLAAYENAPSLRWAQALEKALEHATKNIPALDGQTLVLIDTSASMSHSTFSRRSTMSPAKAAAVFGLALAKRTSNVRVYGFADGVFEHTLPGGFSMLKEIDRFIHRIGEVGHGTEIAQSVRRTYRAGETKRIVIVSDMQTFNDPYSRRRSTVSDIVPHEVPMYGFNLGGYAPTVIEAGGNNRHEFGGLNDATFKMLALIEQRHSATWPWDTQSESL
jgi:hypothetical protein